MWLLYYEVLLGLRTQQRLDRAAFVHRAVPFCHLVERKREIE
jgi:hypothetical protein